MLYLHATAKFAKFHKVVLEPAPKASDVHWLDCWYVRPVWFDLHLGGLLFVNAATKYLLLHPYDNRESVGEIAEVFQQRLSSIVGQQHPQNSGNFTMCKSASRSVIGCMNELANGVTIRALNDVDEGIGVDLGEIENNLNHGIIGGKRPIDDWEKKLSEEPVAKATAGVPYLRLVK